MKKMSIIRFKPKADQFDNFVAALKKRTDAGHHDNKHAQYNMIKKDEVIGVVISDDDILDENAHEGVEWLDNVQHMLLEYNETDRQTISMAGDIF